MGKLVSSSKFDRCKLSKIRMGAIYLVSEGTQSYRLEEIGFIALMTLI